MYLFIEYIVVICMFWLFIRNGYFIEFIFIEYNIIFCVVICWYLFLWDVVFSLMGNVWGINFVSFMF